MRVKGKIGDLSKTFLQVGNLGEAPGWLWGSCESDQGAEAGGDFVFVPFPSPSPQVLVLVSPKAYPKPS